MIPSTVSPSSTLVLGQSLLPGRIFALFPMLHPCPIIDLSIDTSLPMTALSPIIVDFMEQFLPKTVFSYATPVSKIVPDISLEFLGGSAAKFRRTQFTPFRYPFNSPTSTQNESDV